MNVFYEEDSNFKAASVMSENPGSLQIEALGGKRSKIKTVHVLLRFESQLSDFMKSATAEAETLDTTFLWECCAELEFGFEELAKGHLAQIGYWLAKPYWSQGIMTAVVGKACEHAVAQWKLVRITAYVFYVNVTSARVLEKNGFTCEGNLRKHFLKDRRFLDSKLYALVR